METKNVIFGTVSFYDPSKAFGFLRRDDGEADCFVHAKILAKSGLASLIAGQRVTFNVEESGKKSLRAIDIALVN